MADNTETKALLLKIDASAELLKSNLAEASKHIGKFEQDTEEKLTLVDRAFERTGEAVKEHAGEIAVAFTAFFALEHLADLAKEGLEYAASLGEVAQQLGTTTTFLQQFRYAASQYGISQEEADKGLQKFTRTMSEARAGVSTAQGTFKALGVSMADLNKLSQPEILAKVATGIANLKDDVTRAAPEVALFGKTGQQLNALLSQGGEGVNGLAKAAQDLGIILSGPQIEAADRAADKWAELKMVLQANIASFVADNADAIYGLATALERLTLESLSFLKEVRLNFGSLADVFEPFLASGKHAFGELNTQFGYIHDNIVTLLKAMDTLANVPVKLGNAASNLDHRLFPNALATKQETTRPESNLAGDFERAYNVRKATAPKPVTSADTPKGTLDYRDPAAAAASRKAAEDASRKTAAAAKAAEEARVKEIARQKRVADETAKLDDAYLSAQSSLTADTAARAQVEREKLERDTAAKLADVTSQVAAKQLTASEGAALRARIDRNHDIQADAINQRENIALERESATVATARLDGQKDLLQSDASLATTNKERLAIALRLLEADKQAEKAKLQPYLDDAARPVSQRHFDQGSIDAAQAQSATLDQRYAAREAVTRRQYQGPLDSYKEQLQSSVGDTNEALQGIEVSGLQNLESAFTGILTGSKSVSASIKEMVSSIIADFAKLAVEKSLLSLLSGLGGKGGAGGAGVDGSIGNATGLLSGFAEGGHVQGAGTGTSDSILAKLSNGEFIVNAAATKRSLPLLHAINDNRLPRFATGGLVGVPSARMPQIATSSLARRQEAPIILHVEANDYFDARVANIGDSRVSAASPRIAAAGASLAGKQATVSRRRSLSGN